MQRKLNWKLVAGLVAVAVLAGGVLFTVKARGSAAALMKQGDAFAAQHHYAAAFDSYRRGLHREPNHLLLLSKCASMVQALDPEPLDAALEHTRFMMRCYEQILSINPTSEPAQNALLNVEYEWAVLLNDPRLWQALYDRATELIASAHIMQAPANPEARRFLAIAEMKRGVSVDLEEAEVRIRDYLKSALQEFPQDEELTLLLANYYTSMGRRMVQLGDSVKAARFFDQAEDTLQEWDGEARSAATQVVRARMLFAAGRPAEAVAQVRELESGLPELEDRRTLQSAADFYLAFERQLSAAQPPLRYGVGQILGRLRELHPDLLVAQMMLAEWYKSQHQFAQLEETLLLLWEGQQAVQPGSAALVAASLRPAAGSELINFYLYQYEQTSAPELLEKGRAILQALQAADRQDALLPILEGKVAFAEGQYNLAAEKFVEAETRFGLNDPQVLYLMARALWQLGETEAAQDRLLQIVRRGTVTPGVCLDLSRLYLQQRDLTLAGKYADLGTRLFPDNGEVRQHRILLTARELQAEGRLAEAYEVLLQAATGPEVSIQLARLESALGQPERALARLRALPDSSPAALFLLADLTQDASVLADLEEEVLAGPDRFDACYQLYEYHRRAGRLEKAVRFLDRAMQLRPQNYRVYRERLDLFIEAREWSAAEKLVHRARELNVDQVQGYAFEAQLQRAQGQLERAEFAWQQAVDLRPQDSGFWKMLGDVTLQAGKQQSAREAYERAIRLRPDRLDAQWALHRLAHLQGKYQEAADILKKMAALAADDGVRSTYLNYMARYLDEEQALNERQRLAESEPDNLTNLRALAGIYSRSGDYDRARRILEKLNARPRRLLSDVAALAVVLREQGDAAAARALLREYVEAKGEKAGGADWLELARLEASLAEDDQAERYFRQAMELDQTGLALRAYANWLKSRGKLSAALEQFRQIKEESQYPRDWLQYITVLLEAGEPSAASEQLSLYLDRHAADTQTFMLKGLIAEGAGRMEEATAAFDQAVASSPSNPNARFQRAGFILRHREMRPVEEAIADLKQALEFNPEMLEAREMLAQIQADRAGGETRAAMHYLELIGQAPERRTPYLELAKLYLRQDEFWKLPALLERARTQFPADPVWNQVEAQQLLEQGRTLDALALLQRQFVDFPSRASLQPLVQLQLELAHYADVLKTLDEQAELVQESGVLAGIRGLALLQSGQLDVGLAAVAAGLQQLQAQGREMAPLLGLVRGRLSPSRQIMVYEAFLASAYDVAVCSRLAELYIADREFGKADALLADALQRPGEQVPLLLQLSTLRVTQGCPADALKACEKILEQDPAHVLALNNAAYLLSEELGAPERALAYATKAVEGGGGAPRVTAGLLDTLGMVHYRLKNYEQALFYFNRSLKLSESDEVRGHLEMARKKLPDVR